MPVFWQYALKSLPVYSPPLPVRQVTIRLPNGMEVEVTNSCRNARAWSLVQSKYTAAHLVLVGDLAPVLVASMNRRFKGVHQVSINKLKGRRDVGVFGLLGLSQLVTFSNDTDVAGID